MHVVTHRTTQKEEKDARGVCGIPILFPYRHQGFLLEMSWTAYDVYWFAVVFCTYAMIIFTPFEVAFAPRRSLGALGSCRLRLPDFANVRCG